MDSRRGKQIFLPLWADCCHSYSQLLSAQHFSLKEQLCCPRRATLEGCNHFPRTHSLVHCLNILTFSDLLISLGLFFCLPGDSDPGPPCLCTELQAFAGKTLSTPSEADWYLLKLPVVNSSHCFRNQDANLFL